MDSRIRQAIAFMKQNLDMKLTEKELAQSAGLTPQHFCVLFKSETGETPARYFHGLRMDKARELLADGDQSRLSIKEIAAGVGCNDLSHFVRDFEKAVRPLAQALPGTNAERKLASLRSANKS